MINQETKDYTVKRLSDLADSSIHERWVFAKWVVLAKPLIDHLRMINLEEEGQNIPKTKAFLWDKNHHTFREMSF